MSAILPPPPLFLSFLFTFFFPVGSIFVLLLCFVPASEHYLHALLLPYSRTPVSPRGELLHLSGGPVFAATAHWVPLDHLALKAKGACVPGSHRTITIRDSVLGKLPSSESCTDGRLKHTPSLAKKSPICFSVALAWGAGLWFGTLIGGNGGALREWRLANTIFALSLWFIPAHQYLPGRILYRFLVPWFLWLLPADTSLSPESKFKQQNK